MSGTLMEPTGGAVPPGSAGGRGARTPLMEQYRRVKAEYPDAFLFFRLGDFYELFFEDAVRASSIVGLTLTSRNRQDPNPIPMCGLPWHQRDSYVARLLRHGHKVAICDQLEDPAQARGLVQRGVTEVFTPGSVTGDAFLEPASHNFLAALWPVADGLGLCLADASTSDVRLAEASWEEAASLLAGLRVAEWLLPGDAPLPEPISAAWTAALDGLAGPRTTVGPEGFLDPARAAKRWPAAGALCAALPRASHAAAGALAYLDRVQGAPTLTAARVTALEGEGTLRYDDATARHLELFKAQPGGEPAHTLWHHLDLAVSAPGSRRLRDWIERPLADLGHIRRRQEEVQGWLDAGLARSSFREALRGLPDLERLASRLSLGRATPRDLGAIRDALGRLPELVARLEPLAGTKAARGAAGLRSGGALFERLATALVDDPPAISKDGGMIREGHDALRDSLHDLARSGKRWVAELEAQERARTGISSLKVGFNRVFGYYLEVTHAHREKVPADYERRQTLTGAERFVTPELKSKESEILGAEDRLYAREHELFLALREAAAAHVAELQDVAGALAEFDATAALAEAASRYGWIRPTVNDSDRLVVEQGRHPVVERLLPAGGFVPNDVALDGSSRQILLLTGPNMGGKSTYLRQIALLVLLAHCGSWVPARAAEVGRVDRLFTRVGASDRLGAGQSTFLVEMRETADILRHATARSLVLLDEIGRGTSTYDGLALAWAVTEHLHATPGPRPRTIFATHYHELTSLAGTLHRLRNVQAVVREWGDRVVFEHRIDEGAADRSYGIHVGQIAGLPATVIARARDVLAELESERTPAGPRVGPRSPAAEELPLFAGAPHPLEAALQELDPRTITPLEALNLLAGWKARWGEPKP